MKYHYIFIVMLLLIYSSCKFGTDEASAQDSQENASNGSIPEWDVSTDFFTPLDDGYLFKTSESAYLNPLGRNFWINTFHANSDVITISANKRSGQAKYGYGLAFAIEDNKNFMIVLIDTNKQYTVGKVKDGIFSYTSDKTWATSPNLISGIARNNTITVKHINTNDFTILFNNQEEQKLFKYATNPSNYNQFGLVVTIAPDENFPQIPVEVFFKVP